VQPVPQPLHGRKLLLVDADLPAGFALAQTLEQQGATVRIAEDGTRGLQRLRAEPDIAALLFALRSSLQAPCAFEALRDDPQTPHIPLITLGDAGDPEQRDRCLRSGAARHLVRPLQPATLVRAINDSLARQTAPDAAQDGGEPPRATQTAPPAAMPARQKA
jgi:CheY-like chemotaxis protein